jgi:hypothetical protein
MFDPYGARRAGPVADVRPRGESAQPAPASAPFGPQRPLVVVEGYIAWAVSARIAEPAWCRAPNDLIELGVQADDFHFSVGVDFVMVLSVQPIASCLTILGHHDDGACGTVRQSRDDRDSDAQGGTKVDTVHCVNRCRRIREPGWRR